MYKIIALDLDDTLLNKEKIITKENYEALKKAESLGCKIVITTGRPFKGALKYLKMLDLEDSDTYVICYNGAIIYDVKNKKVIYECYLGYEDMLKIYKEAIKFNCNIQTYTKEENLFVNKENKYTDHLASINNVKITKFKPTDFNENQEFLKFMYVDDEDKINYAQANLSKEIKENYASFKSGKTYFEILNLEGTKGKALLRLAKILGIDESDTLAIGDSENDLSMIQMAGLGIAMENALDHVKKEAKFITKSNEENGVAYAINKFVLSKN